MHYSKLLYVVMLFVPIKNIQICIYFFCRHLQCISVCDEREHESNKTDDAMRKTFLKHKINKDTNNDKGSTTKFVELVKQSAQESTAQKRN